MVGLGLCLVVFPATATVPRLACPVVIKAAGKRSGEWWPWGWGGKPTVVPWRCRLSPAAAITTKSLLSVSGAETETETDHQVKGGREEEEEEEEEADPEGNGIPKHVAVILDGNGRWAQERGLTVQDGHLKGIINLKHLTTISSHLGIKLLSVYAFSSQNWTRSHIEVEFLMRIFQDFIQSIVPQLMTQHDLRFSAIGNKSRLPEYLQSAISSAEEMSKANKGLHLVMALSYGGRDDILEATKKIATKVEKGILRATELDEATLNQEMMTSNLEFPDPDLIIRTSGELRLSNFLLWQSAYTELYFTHKLFPDFGLDDLREAITSYQSRKRRYGQRN